jgi:ABC-type sugar transport system permease subunit
MTPHPPAPPMTGGGVPRSYRGPGLLLVVPAALMALLSLVVPTGQTIVRSFQEGGGVLGRSPRSAGLHNYDEMLTNDAFWKALAFSLSLAVLPIVVILLVGPLLAAALDRAGTWPRRVGRVLLSLPLVVFSPVAIAGAWFSGQLDGGVATAFGRLRDTGPWSPTVPLITAASMFGFLCGLALLVFLPVMRGRTQGRPLTPTMLAVGAITILAAVAVALQAFTIDLTLTYGKQATLSTLQYRVSYQTFDIGGGAAISTLTGLMLGVLGVLATIIAVRTGLRVELGPRETDGMAAGPRPGPGGRPIIGILTLVAVAAVTILCSWPWLSALFSSGHTQPLRPSAARVYANTWIPPLLGAIISVGTAYLAALGIGGLRPLGRKSEWLLLPFAPWLFVGVMPLSFTDFDNARRLHLLNHFLVLVPPILLSVPSLLVLTLFCRTRSTRWRAQNTTGAQSFARLVALPALPLAALMGGVTVLFGAQGLLWPLVAGTRNTTQTAPVALLQQLSQLGSTQNLPYTLATPLVMVVLTLLALSTLQVLYLDRLVISTGPTKDPANTPPGAIPWPTQQPQWPAPGTYGPPPEHPDHPGYSGQPAYPGQPSAYGPPPGQPGGYGLPPGQPSGYASPPGQPVGYQPGAYGAPPGQPGQPGQYGSPPGPSAEQPTATDQPNPPPAAPHTGDDPDPAVTVVNAPESNAPAPSPSAPDASDSSASSSGAPGSAATDSSTSGSDEPEDPPPNPRT